MLASTPFSPLLFGLSLLIDPRVIRVSSAFFSCQLHDLRKNIYDFYIFCTSITVRRALPWPPNIVFNKLSASQRMRIGLTVTPPCKVRTVVS